MNSLEVTALTRTYRSGRSTVTAARDISFAVPPGGSIGLVGESGSGKTTVARMIVGLTRPDSGRIVIGERERTWSVRGRAARLRRAREAQMVFQDPYGSLDRRLTVADSLRDVLRRHVSVGRAPSPGASASSDAAPSAGAGAGAGASSNAAPSFGTDAGGRSAAHDPVASLLVRVGLDASLAGSRPHQLSGGQRQRVAIAKALAVNPSVLVLDEAVSALDVSVQAQILTLLNEIRASSGVTLVFVSHDLAVVSEVTDQVLVMYQGVAVEQGATEAVLRRPSHPYTEMLLSSAPGPGWQPERVAELRAALAASLASREAA